LGFLPSGGGYAQIAGYVDEFFDPYFVLAVARLVI
jgi:hypothetical protein